MQFVTPGIVQFVAPAARRRSYLIALFIIFAASAIQAAESNNYQLLKEGWLIQSSASVDASGETISSLGFDSTGWYPTSVPTTVLSALVKNGVYRDPYFGKNLETISYEPFRSAWWYRKEFVLDRGAAANSVRLIFDGINFSANAFLNGKQIKSADEVYGSFKRFDVDITPLIRKTKNVLAVQVFPPKPGDYTIGYVDWNPTPPDRNMGLWREVKLRTGGPVTVENIFVQTKLDLQSLKEARINITGTLVNNTQRAISGNINGEIDGGITFNQKFSLAAGESKDVLFNAEEFPGLKVQNPRIWWPNNLGNPELYNLKLTVRNLQVVSDVQNVTFGIREVADYKNEAGHRGYVINGKKILIRGGGWVDDLLLNEDEKNLEAQIQYVKHLNLNLIRLEGWWGSSEKLYELADRYGIMIMAGVSCQWEWKDYLGKEVDEDFGGAITNEDFDLLVAYMHDQVMWLRNHPSVLVWALASDKLPHPELEKRYRADLAITDPSRPILISTKTWTSEVSGPSGVKMLGPYEYVTPNYWYIDTEHGGAYGFNTETSPGAQPPPMESIQKQFAKEHFWPIDDTWNFHCGRNEFNTLEKYMESFNKRYGPAESLEEFSKKAQAVNYEALRAMFESFGIRKPLATGIVQWMLNAAWPKMYWQLYDYYLMPGGAFYGARKANQPVNISYDYGKRSVYVVNDTYAELPNLKAEIVVVSAESDQKLEQVVNVGIGPNESKAIFDLPKSIDSMPVCFLKLKLSNVDGKTIAENFYWLSSKPDVLDFPNSDWYFTPITEYADFTSLKDLPPAKIQVEPTWNENGLHVNLKNPGQKLAFFVELRVVSDKTGRSILPIFWDDNYISLLPGETKQLSARFSPEHLKGEKPMLLYSGFNVTDGSVEIGARASSPHYGPRTSSPQSVKADQRPGLRTQPPRGTGLDSAKGATHGTK
ncbi:glycoside hydrolase family 2 [bacterium]|nr:glycoside hydrolase family 2 [bacterium]